MEPFTASLKGGIRVLMLRYITTYPPEPDKLSFRINNGVRTGIYQMDRAITVDNRNMY